MPSQADVYNMALSNIGVFEGAIQDPAEASKAAQVCSVWYDSMRDYVLMDHPFKFARRRVTLAASGTAPTNWQYSYMFPTDCLQPLFITVAGLRNPRIDQMYPFDIGTDGTSKFIYTDLVNAELVYTTRIEDLNLWGPLAVSALSYILSAKIAMPMSVKADIANAAFSAYLRELSRAAAADLNGATPDLPPLSELLAVRGATDQIVDGGPSGLRF